MNNGLLAHTVGSHTALTRRKMRYALLREQYATNVEGGVGGTNVWNVRQVNRILHDDIGVKLVAPRVLLPAGRYRARCRGMGINTSGNKLRLYDPIGLRTLMYGNNGYTEAGGNGSYTMLALVGKGVFTLARDTWIELQQLTLSGAPASWGLGMPGGQTTYEPYGHVEFWRLLP